MRLIGAGLFVFLGMLLSVIFLGDFYDKLPKWAVFVPSLLLLPTVYAAYFLFNSWENRPSKWWQPFSYPTVEQMERRGLVVSQEFAAKRVLQIKDEIDEYNDDYLQYFIELEDGSVLYLAGQYLYDYAGINDELEYSQPKIFPCENFIVKRHKTENYVLAIENDGEVVEPEIMLLPYARVSYRSRTMPEDGDIIRDRSFDEIKEELQNSQ